MTKILLDHNFYSSNALKQAIEDFKEVCDCNILNDKIEIELKIKAEMDEPVEEEFCNYVLGLMQQNEV